MKKVYNQPFAEIINLSLENNLMTLSATQSEADVKNLYNNTDIGDHALSGHSMWDSMDWNDNEE